MANKPAVNTPAAKSVARAAAHVEEPKKVLTQRQGFKTNEFVVYPAHGVGQILAIEEQEIAGAKLELFVINFIKDKMTLRVPDAPRLPMSACASCRSPALVKRALETLEGPRAHQAHHVVAPCAGVRGEDQLRATSSRSPRSCATSIARNSQPEQSYSERQLYEAALDRLSREIAVVQHVTETEAVKEIEAAAGQGSAPRCQGGDATPRPTATWKPMAMMLRLPTKLRNRACKDDKKPGREAGLFAVCCSDSVRRASSFALKHSYSACACGLAMRF